MSPSHVTAGHSLQITVMDPFEVRMHFLEHLRRLNASVSSQYLSYYILLSSYVVQVAAIHPKSSRLCHQTLSPMRRGYLGLYCRRNVKGILIHPQGFSSTDTTFSMSGKYQFPNKYSLLLGYTMRNISSGQITFKIGKDQSNLCQRTICPIYFSRFGSSRSIHCARGKTRFTKSRQYETGAVDSSYFYYPEINISARFSKIGEANDISILKKSTICSPSSTHGRERLLIPNHSVPLSPPPDRPCRATM